MNIDISDMISLISALVEYIKDISFTFGEYKFSLWAVILALGTVESINFILGLRKKGDTD